MVAAGYADTLAALLLPRPPARRPCIWYAKQGKQKHNKQQLKIQFSSSCPWAFTFILQSLTDGQQNVAN